MGWKVNLPKLLFTKPTMCLNLLANTGVHYALSSPLDHPNNNIGGLQLYITLILYIMGNVVS